jgi:ribosomal protein L11 methyltransferase
MNYIKINILQTTEVLNEIIIAKLADYPFNGFEEETEQLIAYIDQEAFGAKEKEQLEVVLKTHGLEKYETEVIEEQNWNAQWESDYQPVLVEDFCAVRATFHPPISQVQHEIVITPKMSFGTGHHATTYMMMKQMSQIDFADKSVFDYGCGTGVLAILAEQLGAAKIDAVDIEKWAYENTVENIAINNQSTIIKAFCGEITVVPQQQYDVLLANINRNVLLDTMDSMASRLKAGGFLLTSGFLETDIDIMLEHAGKVGLTKKVLLAREKWRCMLLVKS